MKAIVLTDQGGAENLQVQEVEADTKVVDLMERLRASLGQAGKKASGRSATARKTKRVRKAKGTKRRAA